ncbi:Crp/Fnr family transcriptional regulator [Oceanidesulfovibrio indonesiensis]|uniref:Crp/Fnr family transcriptional regulator n=1 Tax=Oceanidesulfovibrio indonesiensis TaxID=54767 RepID=A0A7M3MHW4_9BACT|nr:Crp/Fnr family transcriptional regulator [Oceanidesulfovibrio indonesiensis]TVM19282.1 Crp/Fnr family transcriptional regulator [Oceanidesulfovibrio indonesiensis]
MRFSEIDLLAELERPEHEVLRELFHSRSLPAGSLLYSPDARENLIFVIRSGAVRVFLACESKEFTLAILGPGDIYATHSGAYVQAMDKPVEMLVTQVNEVSRRLVDVPEFTKTMVRVLGQMLSNSFDTIRGLAFQSSSERLAQLFLAQSRAIRLQQGEEGGVEVQLGLNMQQIADVVGASRQTVSSLINEFMRQGLLEKRGRGVFFLPDLDGLRRTAGLLAIPEPEKK